MRIEGLFVCPKALNAPLGRSTPEDAARFHLAWTSWPADLHSPVRLYLALRASGRRPCLLESAEGPERLARYSFLGVDPEASFRAGRDGAWWQREGERKSLPGNSHQALRTMTQTLSSPEPPPGLPPFCGGWVGWFSYEWASTLEPTVPRAEQDPWQIPEAAFEFFPMVVAFDHASQKILLLRACPKGEADFDASMDALEALAADLATPPEASGAFRLLDEDPQPCLSKERFEEGVLKLQQAIREGEIFQAVLSQRFEQRFQGDPFTLYRVLRLTNPSPHMFFFEADGVQLIGSSPERLVAVRQGRVQNRPIAGTRPRHADSDEDDRLAAELRGDIKERAEHDMLVDLARNDLGRVARIGTVQVKEHAALEKFARVQHLVSRVECELAGGRDALHALAASFPAGTVSGAPKIRAMQLLADLEPETRGPYAGAFGYLDGAGNLDMAIMIRTLVVREDRLSVQAGAGVVHDSRPENEYMETLHKAQALFEAVRLADSPAFRPLHNDPAISGGRP
ncbi:MAG: anthranilate synthase component I family protein [Planctomycetota bacterium]|nr:MAG: anthranilate synthase component I family protein [Planctomycetota bacterium]